MSRAKDLFLVGFFMVAVMYVFPDEAQSKERVCGFSSQELSFLMHANHEGSRYDLSAAAMGILIVETHAGRYGPIGDEENGVGRRSYGPAQIKLQTAEHINDHSPRINLEYEHDYELINKLIDRPYVNITLMVEHLGWLRHEQNLSWRETLVAYNEGLSQLGHHDPETHTYANEVADHVRDGKVACLYEKLLGD